MKIVSEQWPLRKGYKWPCLWKWSGAEASCPDEGS